MIKFPVIIFLVISLPAFGQSKWYKVTSNDWAIIGSQVIAGSADAVNQNLAHYKMGKGKQFWDYHQSWKNKYKNWDTGDISAAYPGSKTWLVFTTDGYHLTRMIDRSATLATIFIAAGELKQYPKKDRWKVMMKKAAISAISNRLMFNIIYKKKR